MSVGNEINAQGEPNLKPLPPGFFLNFMRSTQNDVTLGFLSRTENNLFPANGFDVTIC